MVDAQVQDRRLDELVDNLDGDTASKRARLDEWKLRLDELWDGNPRDDMDAALLATLQRHPSLGIKPFNDSKHDPIEHERQPRRTIPPCLDRATIHPAAVLEGMRSDAVDARRISTSAENS